MIISSDILKNDFEEVIGFFLSWILVGFLTLLFLIFSYLRKTEYNKKHLKNSLMIRIGHLCVLQLDISLQ